MVGERERCSSRVQGGLETFRGALVMPLMNRGYRTGTICFGLLTACKAESEEGRVEMAEKSEELGNGHLPKGGRGPASGAKAAAGSATARAALPHAPRVPRVPRVPPRRWLSRLGRRATDQAQCCQLVRQSVDGVRQYPQPVLLRDWQLGKMD